MTRFTLAIRQYLLALLVFLPVALQANEFDVNDPDPRAMAITVAAVVTNVDRETNRVTLEGPRGDLFTVTVPEGAANLGEINVGDQLVATYLAALEGELRKPTEEELADPWVVLEDAGVSEEGGNTAVGGARVIRAVCTIEGLNRILGTVVIKDPRGDVHVIRDVEAEKMEGVTLGQTLAVVYTEALAMSLERAPGGE